MVNFALCLWLCSPKVLGGRFQNFSMKCRSCSCISFIQAALFVITSDNWKGLTSLGPGRGLHWVNLDSRMVLLQEAAITLSMAPHPFVPQFPWAVNLHYVWKRASAGRDQKPQVFFHVFIFSSPAPDPLLEGAGLESDRVGSRPDCGHPAEATELLTWMGQDWRAALQRNPLKCKHFLSWKEGKLKWKPIVLCRQCSLGSKREWGL